MLTFKSSRRALAAALAASAVALAPVATAQDHTPSAHGAGPSPEQMAELHAQLETLLTLVYAHADFDAVETHLTGVIRDNPERFGESAEAFAAHVSEFLQRVSEQAAADPEAAAAHTATMLIEAHSHR
jgi:hypothetical protein